MPNHTKSKSQTSRKPNDHRVLRLAEILMRRPYISTAELSDALGIKRRAVERSLVNIHDYIEWDYETINGRSMVHTYTDSNTVRPRPFRRKDIHLLEACLAAMTPGQPTEGQTSDPESSQPGLAKTDLTDLANLIWRMKRYLGWRSRSATVSDRLSIKPYHEVLRKESGESSALFQAKEELIHRLQLGIEGISSLTPDQLYLLNEEIQAQKNKPDSLLAQTLFSAATDLYPCSKCRKTNETCLADEWDQEEGAEKEGAEACRKRFKEAMG